MISGDIATHLPAILFGCGGIVLAMVAFSHTWQIETKLLLFILSMLCANAMDTQVLKIKVKNIEKRLEQRGEESP